MRGQGKVYRRAAKTTHLQPQGKLVSLGTRRDLTYMLNNSIFNRLSLHNRYVWLPGVPADSAVAPQWSGLGIAESKDRLRPVLRTEALDGR